MVKKIISERKSVLKRVKKIEFDHISGDGGYSFLADDNGNVKFEPEFEDCQRSSYEYCSKSPDYTGPYLRTDEYRYTENAVAICECGEKIELYDQFLGACECQNCKRWHNVFGQTLLPPEQWESLYEDEGEYIGEEFYE